MATRPACDNGLSILRQARQSSSRGRSTPLAAEDSAAISDVPSAACARPSRPRKRSKSVSPRNWEWPGSRMAARLSSWLHSSTFLSRPATVSPPPPGRPYSWLRNRFVMSTYNIVRQVILRLLYSRRQPQLCKALLRVFGNYKTKLFEAFLDVFVHFSRILILGLQNVHKPLFL